MFLYSLKYDTVYMNFSSTFNLSNIRISEIEELVQINTETEVFHSVSTR